MMNFLNTFRKDEDGAVTVDWVVLTAAVVGLAIAAYTTIETNADTLITAAGRRGRRKRLLTLRPAGRGSAGAPRAPAAPSMETKRCNAFLTPSATTKTALSRLTGWC